MASNQRSEHTAERVEQQHLQQRERTGGGDVKAPRDLGERM